jgi:hypothetical protein
MPLFLMLLAVIVLPMIAYYTGLASSGATGTAAVAALMIFSRIEYLVKEDWSHCRSRFHHAMTPTVLVVAIVALVVSHAAIAWTYQPFNAPHAAVSLAPLALVVLAGCCVGGMLQTAADQQVERAIFYCFLIFCLCALGGVLGLSPPSARPTPKPVFPFNEPSHFGIIFTPFLIFCCVRSRGVARYAIWFAGFVIAASLENLTLVASCGLAALAFVRGAAILPVFMLAAGVGMVVDLSYYLGRVDLSSDNQNLSVLAYIQGWELIGESMGRSNGWGLGFQQLGLHGTDVPAAQTIFEQIQDSENLLDGAFTFAKVVSEFGVFGLGLTLLFLRFWLKSIRRLRRIANGENAAPAQVFAMCVIAGYFVELFVRGAGYFTGSGLLMVGAFWLLSAHRQDTVGGGSADIGHSATNWPISSAGRTSWT